MKILTVCWDAVRQDILVPIYIIHQQYVYVYVNILHPIRFSEAIIQAEINIFQTSRHYSTSVCIIDLRCYYPLLYKMLGRNFFEKIKNKEIQKINLDKAPRQFVFQINSLCSMLIGFWFENLFGIIFIPPSKSPE